MATQSPFSWVSIALTQFATQTQPPAWVVDETLHRVVLFLNHVISREPEAQDRLARQKGRCIQLQWQDKLFQLNQDRNLMFLQVLFQFVQLLKYA